MLTWGLSACATCASACGTLTKAATCSSLHQRSWTATTAAPAKTTATNAVPISCKPPWKTSVAGTIIAPISPTAATTSASQPRDPPTPPPPTPPAMTRATALEPIPQGETAPHRGVAAERAAGGAGRGAAGGIGRAGAGGGGGGVGRAGGGSGGGGAAAAAREGATGRPARSSSTVD